MRKRGELVKLDRNEEPVDDGFSRTRSVDVSYDLIRASGNDCLASGNETVILVV